MSIDARIRGYSQSVEVDDNGRFKRYGITLNLEDRPGGGPAGQTSLTILDDIKINEDIACIQRLMSKCIWGGSGEVYLGDTKLASRESFTSIRLVDNWKDIVNQHHALYGEVVG